MILALQKGSKKNIDFFQKYLLEKKIQLLLQRQD